MNPDFNFPEEIPKHKPIREFELKNDEDSDYNKFPTFKQVNEDLAKKFYQEEGHNESYFATTELAAKPEEIAQK